MKLFLNLKKSSSWKIWTTNATTNLRGVVHNSWLYSTRSEDSRPPHFIDLVDWIACSCIFNIKIFNTGWGFLYLIIKPIISVFHKVFENNIQKYYSKLSILLTLAKRRALPGYARDRGFGSSGKFVLSRFHGRFSIQLISSYNFSNFWQLYIYCWDALGAVDHHSTTQVQSYFGCAARQRLLYRGWPLP